MSREEKRDNIKRVERVEKGRETKDEGKKEPDKAGATTERRASISSISLWTASSFIWTFMCASTPASACMLLMYASRGSAVSGSASQSMC